MAYTASVLFILVNLGGCIYALARLIGKSVREGGFGVGKPRRYVTLRQKRGEFVGQLALWAVMLVVTVALFFIFAMDLSSRDGFSDWLTRFYVT
jgi:hypothetical protein